MLAFAPRPFQDRILSRRLESFTDKTVTSAERIRKALLEIATRGYASAPEETLLGLNAVAAPIFDSHDACVATLAIVGSIQFLPEKPKRSEIDALIKASQQISRKLGHGQQQESPFVKMRSRRT
jgi:DNA-binding IclR family transcriptional regulator